MKRILLYISAFSTLAASAQTQLTLEECIRLAQENNKAIEASTLQLQAAQYDQRSARALFFPTFSLTGTAFYTPANGGYSSGSGQLPVFSPEGRPNGQTAYFPGIDLALDLGWIYGGGIKMEQPLYMGGKIRAGVKMSRIGTEIARQNRRRTEAEVIVETSRAYANLVRANELKQVASAYNDLLRELMRSVERAKQQGMKSQNDVLKVKVKLNESELNLRRAENGIRLATMNLCHYIGRPLSDSIQTNDILPMTDYSLPHHNISERPEYQMLEKKNELMRQKVAMARSEHLPQVGLVGQYGYLNGIELNGQKLMNQWNFLVGVQVSMPIFDFGHRINKIKSAKAQYAQAQAEQADTNEKLTLEATQSYNNLDEARLEERLAASTVEAAEENLRTSRLHYEKGTETLSDYLEAQTLWQQAHETQVEAHINCYLRWIEYQKASGRIN